MSSLSRGQMPSLKAVGLLVASCVIDSAKASFFDSLFGGEQKDQNFGHQVHHHSYEELPDEEIINLLDEHAGDPRQIVTLNGGTTAFNATLNLTGHILLGLGIAAGLMFCLFLAALDDVKGGGGGYGYSSGYGRSYSGDQGKSYYKRSAIDDDSKEMDQILISYVGPLLEKMESNLEAKGTNGHCAVRLSCEANHPGVLSFENGIKKNGTQGMMTTTVTMGESLQRMFNLLERSQNFDFAPVDPRSKLHFEAMTAGRKGKDCEKLYPNCQRPTEDLIQTLKAY